MRSGVIKTKNYYSKGKIAVLAECIELFRLYLCHRETNTICKF